MEQRRRKEIEQCGEQEGKSSLLLSPIEPQAELRSYTGPEPLQALPEAASSPWCRPADAEGGWRSADFVGLHVPLAGEQVPSAWAHGAQLWSRVCPERRSLCCAPKAAEHSCAARPETLPCLAGTAQIRIKLGSDKKVQRQALDEG